MKIGEIARQARVSKSIIRYYENKGLLPRATRDALGYRDYGRADLTRIQLITGVRRLGCSFADIREIMALLDEECAPSSYILELLASKGKEVGKEIDRLRRVKAELVQLQARAQKLGRNDATS